MLPQAELYWKILNKMLQSFLKTRLEKNTLFFNVKIMADFEALASQYFEARTFKEGNLPRDRLCVPFTVPVKNQPRFS